MATSPTNKVLIAGKVSRMGLLKYSPSGMPVLEFTLAVPQEAYGKASVGYYEVVLTGDPAEDSGGKFRIGMKLVIEGRLFQRTYRNRTGSSVTETKVIFDKFGGTA